MDIRLPLIIICSLMLVACTKSQPEESRSFRMGVTPWPADFTEAAVNKAYQFIQTDCDLISQHLDDGIPWQEALDGRDFPRQFIQDISGRIARTPQGKKVLLSVAPLDLSRKNKAACYTANGANQVPANVLQYWSNLSMDHPQVITAYCNYLNRLIALFKPDFVNYGVESNLSTWPDSTFAQYRNFLAAVYQNMKQTHSELPFFISLMTEDVARSEQLASQLTDYTDWIALSSYPYISSAAAASGNLNPDALPNNYFERYFQLAPQKPVAFAETGYAAENLNIPELFMNRVINDQQQQQYLEKLLTICRIKKARLLVWFCSSDYDAGVQTLRNNGFYQPLFSLWKDIGFYNEAGRPRPALSRWKQEFLLPFNE